MEEGAAVAGAVVAKYVGDAGRCGGIGIGGGLRLVKDGKEKKRKGHLGWC